MKARGKVMVVGALDKQTFAEIRKRPVVILEAASLGDLRAFGAMLYEEIDAVAVADLPDARSTSARARTGGEE